MGASPFFSKLLSKVQELHQVRANLQHWWLNPWWGMTAEPVCTLRTLSLTSLARYKEEILATRETFPKLTQKKSNRHRYLVSYSA